MADEEEAPLWVDKGGFIVLIVGTLVSFWGLAVFAVPKRR
jgi:hypothetical protein